MSNNIPAAIRPLKRKTWNPVVVESDPPEMTGSKFGGRASLKAGENYPQCSNCGKDLQLFVQLNLNKLPKEARREFGVTGLVQLFYCTNEKPHCEVECDAWEPFFKSALARRIESENIGVESNSIDFAGANQNFYPPKTITGWQMLDDYPNTEEIRTLKIDLSDDERKRLWETDYPRAGDKLGGYPFWIQGVEYPNCPVCGEKMQLLFQIDSDDNVPFTFGDAGCAHLTQCRTHKDQLAFGWACG